MVNKVAIFAGGCFWGIQKQFDDFKKENKGILETIVGYCGGNIKNPSYNKVLKGNTGHTESIMIIYDSKRITFEKLCLFFMKIHDFTLDLKNQYKSVIFFTSNYQYLIAKKIIYFLKENNIDVKTKLVKYNNNFYKAENYHQKYLEKNKKQCK